MSFTEEITPERIEADASNMQSGLLLNYIDFVAGIRPDFEAIFMLPNKDLDSLDPAVNQLTEHEAGLRIHEIAFGRLMKDIGAQPYAADPSMFRAFGGATLTMSDLIPLEDGVGFSHVLLTGDRL